jgi:hypothetical protein
VQSARPARLDAGSLIAFTSLPQKLRSHPSSCLAALFPGTHDETVIDEKINPRVVCVLQKLGL